MKKFVIRSRFQPFTYLHYETIKEFFFKEINHREIDHPETPLLILAIIRDYETIMSYHNFERGNRGEFEDFRHVCFFNPLSISETIFIIKNVFFELLMDDKDDRIIQDVRENFLTYFIKRVLIVTIPLKFEEIIKAIDSAENYIPSELFNIAQDIKRMGEAYTNVINIFSLFSARTKERLLGFNQEANDITWVFPLFDHEDYMDSKRVQKKNILIFDEIEKYYSNENPNAIFFYTPQEESINVDLGMYGIFLYYSYLKCKSKIENNKRYNDELILMEKTRISKLLLSSVCYNYYKEKVELFATKIQLRKNKLAKYEKMLLEDFKIFESKCEYVKKMVSNKYKRFKEENNDFLIFTNGNISVKSIEKYIHELKILLEKIKGWSDGYTYNNVDIVDNCNFFQKTIIDLITLIEEERNAILPGPIAHQIEIVISFDKYSDSLIENFTNIKRLMGT